jgi:hypothetical protein
LQDATELAQKPLEFVFPRKGPLDAQAYGMDDGVEEAFAPPIGSLAVAGILLDVGDQAGIENALPIASRIKTAIKVEIDPSEVQPDRFGYLFGPAGAFEQKVTVLT